MSTAGVYTYWRNDEKQPVEEPWSVRASKSGHLLHGQRLVEGYVVLEVDAQYLAGRCVNLCLSWHTADGSRKVYYRKDGNELYWRFSDQKDERLVALEKGCELFPILRAGTGPLVAALDGHKRSVVMPNIRRNAGADEALTPVVAERYAAIQSYDTATTHYQYHASEFGAAGSNCWVDERGLLHRLRWKAGVDDGWEVRLENLEVDQQFKGFGAK